MSLNPFPGPQPYRDVDQKRFFGRTDMIRELKATVLIRRCVTVFGPSGAGKSSVLQAGVIPELVGEVELRPATVDAWPTDEPPARRLADMLYAAFNLGARPEEASTVEAVIAAVQRAARRSDRPILIHLDQLEQLLLPERLGERETVQLEDLLESVDQLSALPVRGLYLVLSLREDYLGPFRHRLSDRRRLLEHGFRVSPLSVAELVGAVCSAAKEGKPSQAWSPAEMLDLLLQVRVPGQPMKPEAEAQSAYAQIVCRALWNERDRAPSSARAAPSSRAPTRRAETILKGYLETTLTELRENATFAQRLLETRFITDDGKHRTLRTEEELHEHAVRSRMPAGALEEVIKELQKAAILRAQEHQGTRLFELGHDWLAERVFELKQAREKEEAEQKRLQDEANQRLEEVRLRDEAEKKRRAEEQKQREEEERQRQEKERLRDEAEKKRRAEEQKQREEEERQRQEKERRREEAEKKRRQDDERKLKEERTKRRYVAVIAGLLFVAMVGMLVLYLQARKAKEDAQKQKTAADAESINASLASARAGVEKRRAEFAQHEAEEAKEMVAWSLAIAEAKTSLEKKATEKAVKETVRADALFKSEKTARSRELSEKERAKELSKVAKARELEAKGQPQLALLVAQEVNSSVADRDNLLLELLTKPIPKSTRVHQEAIMSVSTSRDGSLVAVASGAKAWIWNTDGRGRGTPLPSRGAKVTFVAFSPTDHHLIVLSEDKVAQVWDADHKGAPIPLDAHRKEITFAAWSRDGKQIVTTSRDRTARVWTAAGDKVALFDKHDGGVLTAAWSPDATQIVTGSWDTTARIWDAKTGVEARKIEYDQAAVDSVAWSPDGKSVAAHWKGSSGVRVFRKDGTGETIVLNHGKNVRSFSWRPGLGEARVLTVADDPAPLVWSFTPGDPKSVKSWPLKGQSKVDVVSGEWSPLDDGQRIVTAGAERIVTAGADGAARVWSADDGRETTELKGHEQALTSATWTAGGQTIVTASADLTVKVWDASSHGDRIVRLKHPDASEVRRVAYAHRSLRVLTVGAGKNAYVWSEDGKNRRDLGHSEKVRSAEWSWDDKRIATTSDDGVVRIWNTGANDSQAATPMPQEAGEILGAHFAHLDARIVAVNTAGSAYLWSPEDGKSPTKLPKSGAGKTLRALWSHDDKHVLLVEDGTKKPTAGAPANSQTADNGTCWIWDAKVPANALVKVPDCDARAKVAWSPKEDRLFIELRGEKKAWIVSAGELDKPQLLTWPNASTLDPLWSPDGERIAAAFWNVARVWKAADGAEAGGPFKDGQSVQALAWSPDGKRLVISAGSVARIWVADDPAAPALALDDKAETVFSVDWGHDGKHVVTGSFDGMARLWYFTPSAFADARKATADCLSAANRVAFFAEAKDEAEKAYLDCEKEHGRSP